MSAVKSPEITIENFRKHKKNKTKFSALTCYDATLSKTLSDNGVEMILVGDSLGMVIQGHDSTLPVSVEDIIYHLRCVKKGNLSAHIMADMPFMSCATEDLAFENASRIMQAGANSIKIEGGQWMLNITKTLSSQGIPICAHIGLTPQSINRIGGYSVQGRDPKDKKKILKEAIELQDAGAEMILFECIPDSLTNSLVDNLSIPTIGIGAGPKTDGQIMVLHDMLGISPLATKPKFVKDYLAENNSIQEAISSYVYEVREGIFPSKEHTFLD